MISPCAITDAVITALTAASVFGTGMVKRELYDVMELCSGSCAVINISRGSAQPSAFGGVWDHAWTIKVDAYSKDTGDPAEMKDRIVSMANLIFGTFESNPTLEGTVEEMTEITMSYDPISDIVGNYGFAWANPTFTVTVKDYGN